MGRCPLHQWEVDAQQAAASAGEQAVNLICPYGVARFEVTWPSLDADEEDRLRKTLIMMCIFWGYIPYLVTLFSAIELLIRRGTRELSSSLFLFCVTFINEVIIKNTIFEARPERSCLHSCGMPSGHATMASGLLTMCLLDTARRVSPRAGEDRIFRAMMRSGRSQMRAALFYIWRELLRKCTLLPLSTWDELSLTEAVLYSALWFTLLFPVLFARVWTNDHTWEQVTAGACIGAFEAICWGCFVRHLQHRFNHMLGRSWTVAAWLNHSCLVLTHNYALPRFVAEQRVKESSSKNPEQELRWYEEQTAARLSLMLSLHPGRVMTTETEVHQQYLQLRQQQLRGLRQTAQALQAGESPSSSFSSASLPEEGHMRGGNNIELCEAPSMKAESSMPEGFLKAPK